MSNSPLVCYKKISPNCSARTSKIKKITIHHRAGTGSIESMGAYFALPSVKCSSNYGVGNDGRIAMYVPENKRAWTSSNWQNDNQAITIEVTNSKKGKPWPVSDEALEATIELCVDICKRNGIKKLNFTGNKNGNLTMHCYFIGTGCPGQYLKSKFPYIAQEVNRRLGVTESDVEDNTASEYGFDIGDKVKLVSGSRYYNGKAIPSWVFKKTLYVRDINGDKVTISTLKSGAITGSVNAKDIIANAKTTNAVTEVTKPVVNTPTVSTPDQSVNDSEDSAVMEFSIGDKVKLAKNAKYHNGKAIPSWVFKKTLYVRAIKGDNITISCLKTGAITGTVDEKYLSKV